MKDYKIFIGGTAIDHWILSRISLDTAHRYQLFNTGSKSPVVLAMIEFYGVGEKVKDHKPLLIVEEPDGDRDPMILDDPQEIASALGIHEEVPADLLN